MLTCRQATHLMSEQLDRPLSLRERLALRLHLLICRGCRNFGQQMMFLRNASRRLFGGLREDHDDRRD